MRRKQIFCVALAGSWMLAASLVLAEETENLLAADTAIGAENIQKETNSCYMEPDEIYFIDLDGNGETEHIRYETYTDETEICEPKAVLNIYRNDHLLYTVVGNEGTYLWEVSRCTMPNGKTRLLVHSKGDNDWTDQALFLAQKEGESLAVEGELCDLTRGEDGFLSGWAMLGGRSVKNVGEDSVTVDWCDRNNVTGNIGILIEYRITEDGVEILEPPYLLTESDKEWTAHLDFYTVKEPGSTETAFAVKTGDVVKITAITAADGIYYLECVNEVGEIGWIKDTEKRVGGYFEEAIFAG